jgi:hypothetical protein
VPCLYRAVAHMCVGEISWLSVSYVQDRDARELS